MPAFSPRVTASVVLSTAKPGVLGVVLGLLTPGVRTWGREMEIRAWVGSWLWCAGRKGQRGRRRRDCKGGRQ